MAEATTTLEERIKRTPPFIISAFPYYGIGGGVQATNDRYNDMVSIQSSSPGPTIIDESSYQEESGATSVL
jgi:hypothetical protein